MISNVGLSIIIPCYNAEKTIDRCIKSTITNLIDVETIIVNDSSSDKSEEIILNYVNCQNNIIYIQNPVNLGAGRSRNRGIKAATKEYLTFLDSDDELDCSFFEVIAKTLSNQNPDLLVYDAKKENKQNEKYLKMFFSKSITSGFVNQKEAMVFIRGCSCGKIYRKSIITSNNIEFGSIQRNEDLIFSKTAVSFSKNVFYIDKALYLYHFNENSLMNNKQLLDPQNCIDAFNIIKSRIDNDLYKNELNSIYYLEVLYSTTITNIALDYSNEYIRKNFKTMKEKYMLTDCYRKNYLFKYRLALLLFELNLFWVIKLLF